MGAHPAEGAVSGSTEPRTSAHLRVIDLHKSYGDNHVLRGITFDAFRGKTNMILGKSGSGKTVLLRQLMLIEHPDRGRVELDGLDLVSLPEVELVHLRKRLGMVFQDSALFDSLSVFENVSFPLREQSDLDRAEIEARVVSKLRALGVLEARDMLPAELSGGMKRRVAVARAMVTEPEILVYDEPTRGLDPLLSRSVDRLIEETRQGYGVTSIVISHDMKSVKDIGHHVNMLEEGRIVLSVSRDEFFGNQHPLARAFLAASGVKPGDPAQYAGR